ncbi:cobalamin biosynthesis protein [Nocardia neocaledoniensis]|uniref:cobalamin biosynthesis protein n=1 Tax=Nocardia neocaledoniensis TaxID=236511 RepID=UPI001FC93824|nr:cobalamin biosynthesis protein [Nocardia neocaledoniensis]
MTTADDPAAGAVVAIADDPAATTAADSAVTAVGSRAATTGSRPVATTAGGPAVAIAGAPAVAPAADPAVTTAGDPAATTASRPSGTCAADPSVGDRPSGPPGAATEADGSRVPGGPVRVAVGVGARPRAAAESILAAVRAVAGTTVVGCLATIDRRAGDPGILAAARELGVVVRGFTAAELARVEVGHTSERTAAAVGTPSVAEAAALLAGGGELARARTVVGGVVVAAAYLEVSDHAKPPW